MRYFKCLVVLVSVLAVSTVEASLSPWNFGPRILSIAGPLHSICVHKTGISQYLIDNVINGIFIGSPLIKAYTTCFLRESQLISENGKFNYKNVAYFLPGEIRDEAISNIKYCEEKAKDIKKLEDKSFQMVKCWYERNSDSYITCLFRESLLISEKGDLNYKIMAYLAPDQIRDEAISNSKYCEEKLKDVKRVEDRIFEIVKCYYNLNPDIFIFF